MKALSHYEKSWPHPRTPMRDPVDRRLVAVVRRALRDPCETDRAEHVAERVWDWLAEGDS